jgi:hypothetical protein
VETAVLNNKDLVPTEEIIFAHLGKNSSLWKSVFEFIGKNFPEIESQWRYYNDGKSWLMKVTRKTKTIFWLSLYEKTFRTTFYFTSKAEEAMLNSKLPDDVKKAFFENKNGGKLRNITVYFKNKTDLETFKELLSLKTAMK